MPLRSVTTWTRLEPRTRDRDLRDGLRAAVHDPLWLLSRQWQTGELVGEDGGSLVNATIKVRVDPMARFRPGGGDAPDHDTIYESPDDGDEVATATPPLETLVERERVRPTDHDHEGKNVRLAAEAGSHFLRLVGDGFGLTVEDFSDGLLIDRATVDDDGRAYTSVVADRALDGDEVFDAYDFETRSDFEDAIADGDVDVPLPDGIDPDDSTALEQYWDAIETYGEWYEETYDEPDEGELAWDEDRLEYAFAVSTGSDSRETVLTADEYEGGRLDWDAFDVAHSDSLEEDDVEGPDSETVSLDLVPTPSRFKGMPAYRWWEIEDDGVDFSAVEAAPEDLSRLLMLEFGLVYGNDWFTVPIELPIGSLAEVTTMELETTFNETIEVEDAVDVDDDPTTDWNVYSVPLSADGDDRGLFLPPVLASAIESETVEDVAFGRDEMANVGWAIERTVEGTVGQSRDRQTETAMEFEPTTPVATADEADIAYQLSTDVPDNWFPLLPRRVSLGDVRLDRGRLYSGDGTPAEPVGRLLSGDLSIPEGEIPRSGKTVSRSYQYTRWTDGGTHLWSGRDVDVGRGRTDSGLAFDQLVDPRVGEDEPPVEEPDPYPDGEPIPATGRLIVDEVVAETPGGPRENLTDERVVFENAGGGWLDVSGWRVKNEAGHTYKFPAGTELGPGQCLTLHTGRGEDGDGHYYWDMGRQVWNDDGDVVTVINDEDGQVLAYSYPAGPPDIDLGPLVIEAIPPDSPGDDWEDLAEEYVTFRNDSEETVDLSGWRVEDAVGHDYTIPAGTELSPGESIRLRTGSGDAIDADELHWGSRAPIWNNMGDTISVYDDEGTLVLRKTY